jgi:hypothetical protein
MRDAVRDRALLGKQQGEDEKQRQKQARRSHDGVTLTKARERGKRCCCEQNKSPADAGGFKWQREGITELYECCDYKYQRHTANHCYKECHEGK